MQATGMSRRLLTHLKSFTRSQHRQCSGFNAAKTKENIEPQRETFDRNVVLSNHSDCEVHDLTLVQKVFQSASRFPDKIATECGVTGRKYTYEAMRQMIKRFGSSLTRMGFKKGDVFGMILPNLPEFPIALLGAAGLGMPVTMLNPLYTPEEMARQLNNTKAKVIIGIPHMAEALKEVAKRCREIRCVILIGPPLEGFIPFHGMLQDSGDLFNENLEIDVDNDIFLLPHSSGTSGLPKSVMLTHRNVGVNVKQLLHPTCGRTQPDEVYIGLMPFFHTFGVTVTMLTGFELGAKLVTLPKLDLPTYFKSINENQPTVLHLVPALLPVLMQQRAAIKPGALDRLLTIVTAAAPLSAKSAEQLLTVINQPKVSLQDGYGMSETAPAAFLSPLDNVKLGSCGGPLPRTKAKVVSLDNGQSLGPYQNGEIYVAGPQVMKGYLNNEKATREAIDHEGWLRTGDVGYYDEDAHFFIVDRVKELIKVKGNQVAPAELESILRQHPAVADCAVIGIPNEETGELPRAYIVKRPGSENVTEHDIASFVDAKVAPFKKIRGGVAFTSAIPRNNMGKILRRELRTEFVNSNTN